MTEKLDPAVEAVWISLMRAPRALLAAVQNDLKAKGFPPLEWYDVLLELGRANDGRLRQRDLADRLLLARYNLSRLLDRLEREDLIRREPCPEDARGAVVATTEKGRALRQAMWPAYADAVTRRLTGRLGRDQLIELAEAIRRLGESPIKDTS